MAQNHGIYDRIGLSVKEIKSGAELFPGWVSGLNQRHHYSDDGWVSTSLDGYEQTMPTWLSEIRIPDIALSREYNVGYGRYPYKCRARHRYELTHLVDGRTNTVYCNLALGGVYRAVQTYRYYAQGWYEIDVFYSDGTSDRTGKIQFFRNSLNFSLWRLERVFSGKSIDKVVLKFDLDFGDVVYHDTGDRSPRNHSPYYIFAGSTNIGHRLYGNNINRLVEYEGNAGVLTEKSPSKILPIPNGTEIVRYIDYGGYNGWGGW